MPLNGVDISNHNHPIDPSAIPGDFVIMRASEGKGMRDEHFPEYDDVVGPTPKLPGAYHFCWVGDAAGVKNTPQQEAANFAAAVKDHLRPGFLMVCDWEPRHHGRDTDWAVDFALEVERLTGRTPILYANHSTLSGGDWSRWRREIGGDYWLAGGTGQYDDRTDGYVSRGRPANPAGWGDPAMHQYTEYGYLPGWAGRLDLNIFYGDADDWRALADPKEIPVTNRTIRGFKVSEDAYWSFLALEELAVLKGWCKRTLDIYQGTGYSSLSGGTHTPPGGAMDFWQSSNPRALLHAARNGGFPGWHRTPAQGFAHHVHAGTNLPSRPYSYQIAALKAGYNGLGSGGYGGRDDGPRDGVQFRDWKTGLEWLRAEIEKEKAKQKAPAAPRAIQTLPDYWPGWLAVDRWDNADGDDSDVVLYGISDADLIARLEAKGFTYYEHASLHERARFLLADFVQGMALENTPRNDDEVAWDALNRVMDPPEPGVTWVELRPIFDAAHSGGAFGPWGEQRTRHSVRAVQAGLNQISGATLIPEDGIFGAVTRTAVSNFQVAMRGATTGTAAADGVPGVHDFLHLVRLCSERTGLLHRARFLY